MTKKKRKSSGPAHPKNFEAQASEPGTGLVAEFWQFLHTNKKWWMIPIVVTLLMLTGLVLLGGTALAPFIYTLF